MISSYICPKKHTHTRNISFILDYIIKKLSKIFFTLLKYCKICNKKYIYIYINSKVYTTDFRSLFFTAQRLFQLYFLLIYLLFIWYLINYFILYRECKRSWYSQKEYTTVSHQESSNNAVRSNVRRKEKLVIVFREICHEIKRAFEATSPDCQQNEWRRRDNLWWYTLTIAAILQDKSALHRDKYDWLKPLRFYLFSIKRSLYQTQNYGIVSCVKVRTD